MISTIVERMKRLADEGAIFTVVRPAIRRKLIVGGALDSEQDWGIKGGPAVVWEVFPEGIHGVHYCFGRATLAAGGRDIEWTDRRGNMVGYMAPINESPEVSTDDAMLLRAEWREWLESKKARDAMDGYLEGFRAMLVSTHGK